MSCGGWVGHASPPRRTLFRNLVKKTRPPPGDAPGSFWRGRAPLMIPPPLVTFFVFVFGAILGSFLNVCILRIPLGQSILHPPSRCAACGVPIPGFFNLPIVGYFLLQGRSRCCGAHLDPRYPMVEAGTAFALAALWTLYPPELFGIYALLVSGLIVASAIDLDYLVIPDFLTIGGVVAGISLSYLFPALQGKQDPVDAMIRSSLSAAIAGGALWLVARTASWFLQKEAMGIGDAKLLAALGAFLGWPSLPFLLAVSSLIGTAVGIGILNKRKQKLGIKVPYGPYLALAALLWLLGGMNLFSKYLSNNFIQNV
ncbi:MAG: prepilin peptidase [Proteobacteria bacterium]|nr:prepilin peptidase [Pseudomonadota bacterium]NBS06263.1 prepilin peptidase [Verrucomicrobiota bacterium]NBS49931.1 prepilin peptidase [Verrucomicrobiota bacterium]NBT23734.1 prepilin peptidase [bacterium]